MGSGSAWTARVLGATTSSSSGSGDRSSTRRSTSELTAPSPRPVLRSAGISTSTTHADRIRALTGGRRIEPTSPSCRRSRRPEPGRPSTYQSGKPVPTNRASSLYVTDWRDARGIPAWMGAFDLADFIDYVIDFVRYIGTNTHVIAVCQPSVPVLAAAARMA